MTNDIIFFFFYLVDFDLAEGSGSADTFSGPKITRNRNRTNEKYFVCVTCVAEWQRAEAVKCAGPSNRRGRDEGKTKNKSHRNDLSQSLKRNYVEGRANVTPSHLLLPSEPSSSSSSQNERITFCTRVRWQVSARARGTANGNRFR